MRRLIVKPAGSEDRFEKQWKWNAKRRTLENHELGVIFQVVDIAYQDTGKIHHEGFVILSRRTELHVAVRDDGQIGLVFHRRENVIPPPIAQLAAE
jgi:hypothetical protein